MNKKYISRFRASRALIALTFPLFLASCGTDSNAQVATLIQKEVSGWSGVTSVETPQATLIQEVTGADSLLLLNELIGFVNEDYNRQLNLLKANAKFLSKAKDKLYFDNGEVNQYYKKEVDGRIAEMKKICTEINTFSDGLSEVYELNRGHIFKPYNDLKNKKNTVVTKVYKALLNYNQTNFNGGTRSGTAKKTETRYFFLSPDGTQIIKSASSFSAPQGPQVDFLKFERYSVDNEGVIKIVSAQAKDSKSEDATIVAKYIGSEFIGYCNVAFKTDAGEEIYFIDPNLGDFANECGMKDEFVGKKFKITCTKGEVNVHTEEGNETLETEIIKKLELIQQ